MEDQAAAMAHEVRALHHAGDIQTNLEPGSSSSVSREQGYADDISAYFNWGT